TWALPLSASFACPRCSFFTLPKDERRREGRSRGAALPSTLGLRPRSGTRPGGCVVCHPTNPQRKELGTMSVHRCRWGILGTASIARKNWRAIRHAQGAELVGVASRDIERPRAFIAES